MSGFMGAATAIGSAMVGSGTGKMDGSGTSHTAGGGESLEEQRARLAEEKERCRDMMIVEGLRGGLQGAPVGALGAFCPPPATGLCVGVIGGVGFAAGSLAGVLDGRLKCHDHK